MRKLLAMLTALLLLAGQLFAQQKNITGKVTDDKGIPIPNAFRAAFCFVPFPFRYFFRKPDFIKFVE